MKEEIKYYSPLIVYFLLLPLLSGNAVFITLIIEILATGFIFLYRFLEDESLFYVYIFFSFLAAVPPFYTKNIYDFMNLALLYTLLFFPIAHIIIHKFKRKYGKIDPASILYYLSSLPLSFFLITLLLFIPVNMGVYVTVIIVFIVSAILYYMIRS